MFNFGGPINAPSALLDAFGDAAKKKFARKEPAPAIVAAAAAVAATAKKEAKAAAKETERKALVEAKKPRKPKKVKPVTEATEENGGDAGLEIFVGNLPLATTKADVERLFKVGRHAHISAIQISYVRVPQRLQPLISSRVMSSTATSDHPR